MNFEGAEWVTLREAERIIGRSRRQIWRYIYDGSWDTRAVTDNLNRPVTYVKLTDILRKKTEIESVSNPNPIPGAENEISEDIRKDEEMADLTIIQQLLERLVASQDYQGDLLKKCLYVLEKINLTSLKILVYVAIIGIVIVATCFILNVIIK